MLYDVNEYAYLPSEITTPSEFSCYASENQVKGKIGIRQVPNIWIGDSGASCHITCTDAGMYDCRRINSAVKIGNGKLLRVTKIGKKRMSII
jgi:glutaredoxin